MITKDYINTEIKTDSIIDMHLFYWLEFKNSLPNNKFHKNKKQNNYNDIEFDVWTVAAKVAGLFDISLKRVCCDFIHISTHKTI